MKKRTPVLCLVAKLPVAGKSKTRLGKCIGNEEAVEFSRESICDLTRRLGAVGSNSITPLTVLGSTLTAAIGALLGIAAMEFVGVGCLVAFMCHMYRHKPLER